jgi:tRNA A37 threonylcarbamoyladenosine modification protein TsaB
MLSLSIFCSSQTISLAIYNEKKLIFLKKKKILDNKIEGIFKILKECTNKFELKKISQIYFSTGPGSFTALRSIKVISQALALSSNSVLRTTSSFSPLIASIQNKDKKVLACFKSTNNKFFYQIFEKIGKIFKPKYPINFGDENQLISYYLEKKQNYIGLPLYSSDKLNNLNTKKIKPIIKKVDASHLGLSIFLGYASKKTKIFYHNTYYE